MIVRMMPLGVLAFAAASAVPFPLEGAPVRPVAEQTKIDYLLGEVRNTEATFLRNGQEHTPARAAAHLARKLKFAGRRVQTVREFIAGIATRSSDSGKIYEVRWPDGRKQPLGEWLLSRLAAYEKKETQSRDRAGTIGQSSL